MGNANLRLARGDSSGAVDLCKEVIRQGNPFVVGLPTRVCARFTLFPAKSPPRIRALLRPGYRLRGH